MNLNTLDGCQAEHTVMSIGMLRKELEGQAEQSDSNRVLRCATTTGKTRPLRHPRVPQEIDIHGQGTGRKRA